ncbi:phosphatidylglycerophosphatase A family protein [Paraglaciecola polaris]|uniref:Phosphatidylglycerophosphatase A n=1 Tax=Paraglaciecola polaris LMG 21857 TaxID=1129793 RepID=K7A3K0_9ALTE|nr:phosphatidylglycerophosphatase A [Paraglaciecola polaris]GAC35478.1 phosphatidylglycerophosphatase A [Paraglaciecola polaris LMG 21857]
MDRHIRKRVSLANPIHFLALGFGSGLAPKAPGTFGTLAALPLVCLLAYSTSLSGYLLITLLVSVVGIWLCDKTARDMMVHDDSSIVWDEIAGMLIAMIAVPISWQTLLLGFVLFRIFDILKPWPISYLDARVHGGFGIMVDDLLAGFFTLILMHLILYMGWL